jgi:hypothetical protein
MKGSPYSHNRGSCYPFFLFHLSCNRWPAVEIFFLMLRCPDSASAYVAPSSASHPSPLAAPPLAIGPAAPLPLSIHNLESRRHRPPAPRLCHHLILHLPHPQIQIADKRNPSGGGLSCGSFSVKESTLLTSLNSETVSRQKYHERRPVSKSMTIQIF